MKYTITAQIMSIIPWGLILGYISPGFGLFGLFIQVTGIISVVYIGSTGRYMKV